MRYGWAFAFEELTQRRGDYGLSMAACALRVEDGRVAEARVGIGSVVERPTLFETGSKRSRTALLCSEEASLREPPPQGEVRTSDRTRPE